MRGFTFFILLIVQYGSGQNITGPALRGSSEIAAGIPDLTALRFPDAGTVSSGPSPAESRNLGPAGALFIGKGMNGVYLSVTLPGAPPEEAPVKELFQSAGSDGLHQVCHLDGSQCGVKPFVPAFRAGPFDSLLDAVGGKNAVDHRFPGLQANIRDPLGDFRRNEIEMGPSATDHGTQADHGIVLVLLRFGQLFRE